MRGLAAVLLTMAALHAADPSSHAPTSEEIVSRLVAADDARAQKLRDYSSIRRYSLENKRFGVKASLTARVTYRYPGVKQYEILAESGPGAIRNKVFKRMLDTEIRASQGNGRTDTRISPQNYDFQLLGISTCEGRPCYELSAAPKTNNPLLFRGRIRVDAEDYAVAHIDGEPAQNPSFWLRKTTIAHRYAKFGAFWLPVANQSGSDVTVFGHTDVRIEYGEYRINEGDAQRPGN